MDALSLQMKNNLEIVATNKYSWNPYFANPIAHTDISAVVEELESIQESFGEITPKFVIESAKNKTSVLHDYFDWDDTNAANQWRLRQASKLLGSIEVNIISDSQPKNIQVPTVIKRQPASKPTSLVKVGNSLITENEPSFFIKFLLKDLERIKAKLFSLEGMQTAIDYIDVAIAEIESKESTETKNEITIDLSDDV